MSQAPDSRVSGTVKWFAAGRNYGFIVMDGTGEDVYFHRADLEEADIARAREGDRFSFEYERRASGLRASKLQRA